MLTNGLAMQDEMAMTTLGPIILVAPYSPGCDYTLGSFAAAHKVESVLRILGQSGRKIILVDSAHTRTEFCGSTLLEATVAGVPVTLITPATLKWRPVGKLLNLCMADGLARSIAREKPSLIWIYNSYAFEAQIALTLERLTGAPIVLELEDMPRARRRGWADLKPRLDEIYLERLKKRVTLVTCVNENIASQLHEAAGRKIVLPYIVGRKIAAEFAGKAPFGEPPYTLGYFGGLSEEKGAGMLLRFLEQIPEEWKMAVTGRGALATEFHRCAERVPEKLRFVENASDDAMYSLMGECDAIVNPHTSIESMQQGVFPFKVLEALVSGRALISTELPPCGFDLRDSVAWFDGSPDGLRCALADAHEAFKRNQAAIRSTVREIHSQLAEPMIYHRLKTLGIPL